MQRFKHGGDIYEKPGINLDFSINVNPLGMPDEIKEAVIQDIDSYSRYPDPHCRDLRKALAEHHKIKKDQILCGNGAADCIFRICAAKKPNKVLVLAPTFSEYERPVQLFGGRIFEYALDPQKDFLLSADFLEALTEDLDMVFLCNPNNPTGRLVPKGLMEQIAKRCQARDITLVIDECFLPLSSGTSMIDQLESYSNLLILRAFTKLYAMAGLRLGYLLGAAKNIQEIEGFGAEWSVSIPAQTAGISALSLEPEWSDQTNHFILEERDWMIERLKGLGAKVYPSETNFILLSHEVDLFEKLKEQGILVRNCANFTGLDESFIRIGLKTRGDNEKLIQGIGRIVHG